MPKTLLLHEPVEGCHDRLTLRPAFWLRVSHHTDNDGLPVANPSLYSPAAVGASPSPSILVYVKLVVVSLTGQEGTRKARSNLVAAKK